MARKQHKCMKPCKYCGKEFQPMGRRHVACDYCKKKSHNIGALKYILKSFKRMLGVFGLEKNKSWYKRFVVLIKELEKIIKEISEEMKGNG